MLSKTIRYLGILVASMLAVSVAGCTSPGLPGNASPGSMTLAVVASDLHEVAANTSSIETTLTVGDGAKLARNVGVDDVLLSDGFKDMTVTSVDRLDDKTLVVRAAGDFAVESGGLPYAYGTIALAPGAIVGADDHTLVRLMITQPTISVASDAMTYADGAMEVYLGLSGAGFADALTPDMFTVVSQGKTIPVTAVEKTYDFEARLTLALWADDLDDAISQLDGGSVTASSDALTVGAPLTGPTTIAGAHVDGYIVMLDVAGDSTAITVVLSPTRGHFVGLTPESLTFAGDFEGADAIVVTPTEMGASVQFTIPRSETIDQAVIAGRISVADGVLMNLWGTRAGESDVVLKWADGGSKGVVDSALSLWGEYGDTVTTIGNVAGTAAKAFGAAKCVLEMFGVIESTNAKIDKVYDKLGEVDKKIDQMYGEMNKQFAATHNKLNSMQADITNLLAQTSQIMDQLESIRHAVEINERARQVDRAVDRWGDFRKSLKDLESLTASFKNRAAGEIFSIVKNDSVTVHKDSQGTVAVRDRLTGRANTGFVMNEDPQTYRLPESFVQQVRDAKKVPQYGLDELQRLLAEEYGEAVAQDVIDSIALQAVYTTASRPEFSNYANLFYSVAGGLGSHTLANNNPLFFHDTAVESVFNWDPDTHPVKQEVRLYISTVLTDAAVHLFGLVGTMQGNESGEVDRLRSTLEEAVKTLIDNTGVRPVPKYGYVYNTHARQPLTVMLAEADGNHSQYFSGQGWLPTIVTRNPLMLLGYGWFDYDWPRFELSTSGTNAAIPELFVKPVLTTAQVTLMSQNASLRNTEYWMEMYTHGLSLPYLFTLYDDDVPYSGLHTQVKFFQTGNDWGFTGTAFFNQQTMPQSYSRTLGDIKDGRGSRVDTQAIRWAYFSAS